VSSSWEADGDTHTWTEPAEIDEERKLWALIELWLATGDAAYQVELETSEMDDTYSSAVTQLWWQNLIYMAVDVALDPSSFPEGWGDAAQAAITDRADSWLVSYETHAYRRVWYAEDHSYFSYVGWGNAVYLPMRSLVAAWRVTGLVDYREAALLGLDFRLGANPQGRIDTTGLGEHSTTVALHLPSWGDEIVEPSPGITLYGSNAGVPWSTKDRVYGISEDARSSPFFGGVDLPLMPPPWNNDELTIEDVGDALYDTLPALRRLVPLESTNVSGMEFTIWETTSPAMSITGCLLGAGWEPGTALTTREPRTEDELRSSLWMMP
jgi:hypothetical protein